MIKLQFSTTGRPTNLDTKNAVKRNKEIIGYFDENPYNSELIRATNTLDDVNRCIFAIYIANDMNLTKTATELHASTQYLKKRLEEIRTKIKEAVDMELLEEEKEIIHLI